MKKTAVISLICFMAIASAGVLPANAQTADIEVSYIIHAPNFRNGNTDLTNQYILLSNALESRFFSPMTEYIDSLNSTPEGKAKYQEMTRNAVLGGKIDDIPHKDGSFYVVKSFHDNTMRYYDSAGLDKYFCEEPTAGWNWEIGDSVKVVMGYECVMATAEYHGRNWTAWFAPEIPVQNGPWKLHGLPGLIMEAYPEGEQYRFEATGIQQTGKSIGSVYLADEYEKISRIDFLKAKRSFLDNPFGQINAQMGDGGVKIMDENGNEVSGSIYVSADVVDFLETDYH